MHYLQDQHEIKDLLKVTLPCANSGFSMTQVETSIYLFYFLLFVSTFQAAVGDLPIQDVCYSPTTKKLMVRLADACDRYAAGLFLGISKR